MSGPRWTCDEATARLLLECVAAMDRELERVAPGRRSILRPVVADLARFLAGCGSATEEVTCGEAAGTIASVMVPPATDLCTASELARLLGVSSSFVRRTASQRAGVQVGGRWLFPRPRKDAA